MNSSSAAASQRRDLLAGQRAAWGDAVQMCADCDSDAEPFSCYCKTCEQTLMEEEKQ